MQLRTDINKQQYRKRLNKITVLSALALLIISLCTSALLIRLLATGEGSNFWLNVAGVVVGCIVVGFTLKKLKPSPYFDEVAYIWDLKHELNLIQRKLRAIEAAAAQNEPNALLILAFSYAGSRLVWELDDNTLIMSELNLAEAKLQQQITDAGLTLDVANYHRELLARF